MNPVLIHGNKCVGVGTVFLVQDWIVQVRQLFGEIKNQVSND